MCPHSVPSTVVASVSAPESLNFLYIRLLFRSLVPQTEAAGVEGLMSGEFSMSPIGVATYCIPAVSLGTAGSASPLALTYSMRPALAFTAWRWGLASLSARPPRPKAIA